MRKNLYQKYEMPFVALFVVLLLGGVFAAIAWQLGGAMDGFADTDTYMRALRIKNLIEDFSWAEVPFAQSNYPFGEILHWTRPMDLLWLSLAYPLMLFFDVKEALLYSGYLLSPVLNVLSCLLIVWGLRPFLNSYLRLLVVVLFLLQVPLISIYSFTRPDHHSLLALLSLGTIACALRFFAEGKRWQIIMAGAASGMMIWVAAEGLLFYYAVLATLFFLWLFRLETLGTLKYFSGAVFLVVLFAWIVNPPFQGYLFPDNGRLSVLTVFITLLTFGSFALLGGLDKKGLAETIVNRVLYAFLFASLSFLVTLQVFGANVLFSPPIATEIQSIWLFRVVEMFGTDFGSILFWTNSYLALLAVAIAILFLIFRAIPKDWLKPFMFIFLPLALYTVLTIIRVRFAPYAATFAVFIVVFVLHIWLSRAGLYEKIKSKYHSYSGFVQKGLVAFAVGLVFLYVFLISLMVLVWIGSGVSSKVEKTVFMSALARGEGTVLADTFRGPEIMWKAGRPVVGTPYHRNVEGIRDTHDMFFASNDEKIKELILKHKVTDVVFFSEVDSNYYSPAPLSKNRFYYRIITGKNLPCWLEEDESISRDSGFVILHVRQDKMDCLF